MDKYIKYDREIEFKETVYSDVRFLINDYADSLKYVGDNFVNKLRSQCRHYLIGLNNERRYIGLFGISDSSLTFIYVSPEFKFMERQILEKIKIKYAITSAYVLTYDYHSLPLIMDYAKEVKTHAYQFQLLDKKQIRIPMYGLKVSLAKEEDAPFLDDMCFINNAKSYIKRQEAWLVEKDSNLKVGIGLISPIPGKDDYLDIGMFTAPNYRREGIGRSTLSMLMKIIVESGRIPVAACNAANIESRRTLESAGLTHIGSILKVELL